MKVFVCLILLCSCTNAAKILCVFPGVAHSHFTVGYSLMKGLANKGHEVTFVSPFAVKEEVKNLKNVILTGLEEKGKEMMKDVNMFDLSGISPFITAVSLGNMGILLAEETLSNEAVQKILKSKEKFDLVIVESFLIDSLQAISHYYNVPSVLLSTLGPSIWTNHIIGTPDIPSFIPHVLSSDKGGKMSFSERLYNTVLTLFQKLYDHVYFYPKHNELVKKYFPGSPNIYDLIYNTSLILSNSHISYTKPLPTMPNMIEVGGYHVDPPKKLPDDLQKIFDESKNGVIYFSMGSNLKSEQLHPKLRKSILKVFSGLKQTILWKFENNNLPGKPDNVIIKKWFPQNDILAHPNTRLFITHGGLLSTIETIYHGVPIVAIPVFGDQYMNAATAVHNGYAVQVPYEKLEEKTFSSAVNEVLSNSKYRENAKTRSMIFHDQQVKPMDKAAYWIEYVIKHRGAPHLRSSALNLTSYQYYMVDVIIFLTLLTIGLLGALYKFFKLWMVRRQSRKSLKSKSKKQ